jgi:hypothetical protein
MVSLKLEEVGMSRTKNTEKVENYRAKYRHVVGHYVHKYYMVKGARKRAKQKGLDFNLKTGDIEVGTHCPILGLKFVIGNEVWYNSPSLDRIDNTKGYVKGNVIVVSFMANSIKNQATPDQIRKVADFYTKLYKEKGIVYDKKA